MAISRSSLDVDLSTLAVSSNTNIFPNQTMALPTSNYSAFFRTRAWGKAPHSDARQPDLSRSSRSRLHTGLETRNGAQDYAIQLRQELLVSRSEG